MNRVIISEAFDALHEFNNKSNKKKIVKEDADLGYDIHGQKIRLQDLDGTWIEDYPDLPWKYQIGGFGYMTLKGALRDAEGDRSKIKNLRESSTTVKRIHCRK